MIRIEKDTLVNGMYEHPVEYCYEIMYSPKGANCLHTISRYLEDREAAIALAKLFRKFGHHVSLFCEMEFEYNFTTDKFELIW